MSSVRISRYCGDAGVEVGFSNAILYYIRTYHNVTADWVSRESKEVVESELKKTGWTKAQPAEGWGLYLVDALKGVFRWPGDRGGSGLQVRGAREGETIYQAVEGRGVCIEVGEGWRPWGYAWKGLGGDLCTFQRSSHPCWRALDESLNYGSRVWRGEEVVWIFASIGQDLWLGSRRAFMEAIEKCTRKGVLVDVPSSGPKDSIIAELKKQGYSFGCWKVRCTDYGDAVAKVKWVIVGLRSDGDGVAGWKLPAATATEPYGISKLVRSGHQAGEWLGDEWSVCLSRRISTSGENLEMHSSRFLFYICLFAQLFLNVEQMPLSGRNLEQMVLATEILNVPFFKK